MKRWRGAKEAKKVHGQTVRETEEEMGKERGRWRDK